MRLLVVSNRLPVTVVEREGKLQFQRRAGGLVSGLSAYLDSLRGSSLADSQYIWVGWPGVTVNDRMKEKVRSELFSEFQAYPVFISERDMETFYYGFCNRTIWPLFHYFPSRSVFNENDWKSYKRINSIFCDAVMEVIKPDDVVWIHDYHLMLLPKLLREKMSEVPIGFFLHIPFPSFELFRMLSKRWSREILEGLLGAHLIGFHTHDYTQYFLRCILRILGYEHNMGQMVVNGRVVKADTFPIGIDFQRFYNTAGSPEIQKEKDKLRKSLGGSTVVLSIDRLDYTKGVINRLRGYEVFLERNPQWHMKVVLVMVVVPSRIGVEHYQQMKRQIDELVGRINGRFGSIHWTPIVYQYKSLPFDPLIALYAVSDVALVTPIRDGMNLIAKEYVATKRDQEGVLVLSEMAGASKELGEAITIQPSNVEEIADALKEALEMPKEERIKRNQVMQTRLKRYDVVRWADDFIRMLSSLKDQQKRLDANLLRSSTKDQLVQNFIKANRRLLLLDYDGTLVPFAEHPEMAKPAVELLSVLRHLSGDQKTEIVLISGRDRDTLKSWFGMLDIGLVAEHGAWIKEKNKDWRTLEPLTSEWKLQILPLFEIYTDQLPGSFIEQKEFSIVWHYRKADPELSSIRANELMDDLVRFTANIDVQVLQGSKAIEVRNASVNKGIAALHWGSKKDFDFMMAIGDDWTDEDLFKAIPETAYSIRVGTTQSYARFNLPNPMEALELLKELTKDNEALQSDH
ncbi:MAG: bifunctional alpha,alpha-trehalose-phosphate synthase (UDP-forming)/trehalose-phosphatase [Thermodesulfobacteriota bacterium]